MEEYYLCSDYRCIRHDTNKEPGCYLEYETLFGSKKEIPIILVNDDGNVFEFFTKTKFIYVDAGYSSSFKLPDSTLSFYRDSSCGNTYYRKILPADALKRLEPYMKKPSKCIKQINSYFDWYKKEFIQKQQEAERTKKANSDAQSILSKYWKNN